MGRRRPVVRTDCGSLAFDCMFMQDGSGRLRLESRSKESQFRGCEDFFVYTPSQFVKVDVYDADIGPGLLPEESSSA